MSIPAPAIPVGEITDADRARACDLLSAIHGREVRGGWRADQIATQYAQARLEGYEQAQREQQAVTA